MASDVKYDRSSMFLARLSELRGIGAFVQAYCAEHAIARSRCLRLNLVLEELFVNTVKHGHRGECDAPVWVTLEAGPQAVHVSYEDSAPPFNPYAYLPTAREVGGLGVLLTREMATAGDYAYLFGRNRIRLAMLR
jgi:anti-sigma regulatory factor (Ser/Thr protein kinase)